MNKRIHKKMCKKQFEILFKKHDWEFDHVEYGYTSGKVDFPLMGGLVDYAYTYAKTILFRAVP